MTTCPKCQKEYPGTDEQCPDCHPADEASKKKNAKPKRANGYYDYESETVKFSFKHIVYLIVGIFVIIFLVGVVAGIISGGEEEEQAAAKSYVEPSPPPMAKIKPEELFDHKQLVPWDGNSDRNTSDEDLIRDLFMTITRANLKEDIELFQTGYSPDFPGFEEKRQKTLAMWRKYDFIRLGHYIAELDIQENTAEAFLIWTITLSEHGGAPRETETTNKATLQKEAGEWKIVKLD